jgi:hypothetical protein
MSLKITSLFLNLTSRFFVNSSPPSQEDYFGDLFITQDGTYILTQDSLIIGAQTEIIYLTSQLNEYIITEAGDLIIA